MNNIITKTFMHRVTDRKVIIDFLNSIVCNRIEYSEGGIDKYTQRLSEGFSNIKAKSIQEIAGMVDIFAGYNRDVITIDSYKINYSTRSKTKVTIDSIDIYYNFKFGISKNGVLVTDDNVDEYNFSLIPRYCSVGDAYPEGVEDEVIDLEYFMGFDLHVEKR